MLKNVLAGFAIVAPITLVVAAVVSLIYSLIAHGTGTVDWGSAVRLAVILGIIIPVTQAMGAGSGTPER
ncbi:MAG: hypothetical protein ACN0LA_03845 [Candidatus Longimicrobiales bacterium M2_2A_002]